MSDESKLRDELKAEWEDMAQEWIGRRIEGEETHRELFLDGWMLDAAGDVSGLDVIDLGCGEGRFARMLAEAGAKVTAIDLCRPFIEYAKEHRVGNETYLLGDMEDLGGIPDGEFDLAISYITLVDVVDMNAAISESFRVLRPGGRFLICNVHPMRMASVGWIKQGDVKLHYPVDNYFDESAREFRSRDGHQWTNFHRTLETHISAFLDAGFAIEAIREPKPTQEQAEEHPHIADELRVPNFTGITHIKLPGPKYRTILDESHCSFTHECRQPSNQAHKTISRRRELAFARQRRQLSPTLHSLPTPPGTHLPLGYPHHLR